MFYDYRNIYTLYVYIRRRLLLMIITYDDSNGDIKNKKVFFLNIIIAVILV